MRIELRMAEPSEYLEDLRQLHSSECLSDKRCRCGDHLRRWRVLKDSPNRGRIFMQCQGAWPMDPSGLSRFCLDWSWEDELVPVPEIFSFSEEYVLHPDARAYFYSREFMKRNRLKILDLTGSEVSESREVGIVRALVHRAPRHSKQTQTESLAESIGQLDISQAFSLRLPLTPSEGTPYASPRDSLSSSRSQSSESGSESDNEQSEQLTPVDYGYTSEDNQLIPEETQQAGIQDTSRGAKPRDEAEY